MKNNPKRNIYIGGTVLKNLPANARDEGDLGSIPGLGSSPGGGNGNLLQYSCLENSMDRGEWRSVVHGATKSFQIHEAMSMNYFPLELANRALFSKQK